MGYAPFPRGGYAPQVGGESRAESHRPPKFFQTTLPRGSLNGVYIYIHLQLCIALLQVQMAFSMGN